MLNRPLIIGLTGGIASGKSTIANYLGSRGAYLIDTDIIAREVVIPNSQTYLNIRQLLGDNYFLVDGQLDRHAIKSLIFHNTTIKTQYESIILPAIREATLAAIEHIPPTVCYALLIAPLLFEKGLDHYTDYNINVDLPVDVQIRRGIARKPEDEAVIRRIIAAQLPRQTRNLLADFVIDNRQDLESVYHDLNKLHDMLCQLPAKESTPNDPY